VVSRLSDIRWPGEPDGRPDLPPVERMRKPIGYRAGWQLEERLQGVGVVLLGLVGLLVVYGIYSGYLPSGLPPPPPPPKGVLIQVPTVNPGAFFLPVIAVMSVALIAVGFKRVFDP
jgi:hypothetical protein